MHSRHLTLLVQHLSIKQALTNVSQFVSDIYTEVFGGVDLHCLDNKYCLGLDKLKLSELSEQYCVQKVVGSHAIQCLTWLQSERFQCHWIVL